MADENVVPLPTLLERLARQMIGLLNQEAANRVEWIEIQEGICLTLAEARDQFPADIEFGTWCDANGFDLNENTRAAAIAMGRQPEALRKCLEATERSSLHTIHKFDFSRFGNVSKPPPRRRKQPTLDLSNPSPEFEKAKDAYDQIKASGEPPSVEKVAKLAGVSSTPARIAVAFKRGTEAPRPLPPDEMPATMRKRYEAALKKARAEIREKLKEEVYKELDVYVRHAKERSERAERILANYNGVMSREDFRRIMACLHTDHNTFQFAAEAFQIFGELEDVLVKPDDPVFIGPPLPATAAELMAMRRRR